MNIIEEIKSRSQKDEKAVELVGTEIRLLRKSQSKTLGAVAGKTCSISYLSKIETNDIKPNIKFLEEICTKLKFPKENLNQILESKKIFIRILKAFYFNNKEEINGCVEGLQGLKNYRALLIMMVKNLYDKDYREVSLKVKKLDQIVGIMSDDDLNFYAMFKGIYLVKEKKYLEAYPILKDLKSLKSQNEMMEALVKEQICEILFYWNSKSYLVEVKEVIELSAKNLQFYKVLEFERQRSFFYLFNHMDEKFLNSVQNYGEDDKRMFIQFFDMRTKKIAEPLNPFFKLFNTYLYEKNNFVEEYKNMNENEMPVLYEALFEYLKMKITQNPNASTYLYNVCLQLAFRENNQYFIAFFRDELLNYYVSCAKYKRYYEINKQVEEILFQFERCL